MFLRAFKLSVAALLSAALVAGCGSGSASTSTNQRSGGGPFGDPQVQACLEKQGVSVPRAPSGAGAGQPGPPPTGTTGAPPAGRRPRGGFPGGNPAQFAKLRAALQKCGVQLGQPGQGGPPPDQGTDTPSQ